MKKIILVLFAVLMVCGCQKPDQGQQNQKLEIEVKPPAPTPPLQVAPTPAPIPPHPSKNFMIGYWDGYYGRPATPRWIVIEYRDGYALGLSDREHGIHRYTP